MASLRASASLSRPRCGADPAAGSGGLGSAAGVAGGGASGRSDGTLKTILREVLTTTLPRAACAKCNHKTGMNCNNDSVFLDFRCSLSVNVHENVQKLPRIDSTEFNP